MCQQIVCIRRHSPGEDEGVSQILGFEILCEYFICFFVLHVISTSFRASHFYVHILLHAVIFRFGYLILHFMALFHITHTYYSVFRGRNFPDKGAVLP